MTIRYHSQNNEEAIIRSYFSSEGMTKTGTFLDIGANDGITLSNTYALVRGGWQGALIEPSPRAFQRLTENLFMELQRGQVELHSYGIGPQMGIATLQESGEHLGKGDVGLLSTFFEEEADKWKPAGNTFYPVEAKLYPFSYFLTLSRFKTFDFVSIDAEKMDMVILWQMDLKPLGVQMLCIEHEHLDVSEIISYCQPFGLKEVARNRQNILLAK